MTKGPDLFTRVELRQKTGIPDDVLNYWMREGVIRAREGGDGRGKPRRFDYPEIMLAAILDELRGFGLNVAAIKGLSGRFHEALDFFRNLGLNRSNHHHLMELRDRKRSEENGYGCYGNTTEPDKFPQYEWAESPSIPGIYSAKIRFDELLLVPALWRAKDASVDDVERAVRLVQILDVEELDSHYCYWSSLTSIYKKKFSGQPEHFERDSTGIWHMTRGDPTGRSWISIDTSAINYELWQGDQSLRD